MAENIVGSGLFRGARFRASDLTGATFRDSDLRGVRIASCAVDGLVITGFDGRAGAVTVDDVDVSGYVAAELDRRHPERVQLRAVVGAGDMRAMWVVLESLWRGTLDRAERLPAGALDERVEGEWSVVETLRHLVFAVDSWINLMLLGLPTPHHPLGLPPTDAPGDVVAAMGLDADARPPYLEVVDALGERWAQVRAVLGTLTDGALAEARTGTLMPGEGAETVTVEHCVRVVLREHSEHRRYTERDLTALTALAAPPPPAR